MSLLDGRSGCFDGYGNLPSVTPRNYIGGTDGSLKAEESIRLVDGS